MKKAIVIQARMGSSRLPGKVLLKYDNKISSLVYMLQRLSKCKVDHFIIATTTNSIDDEIEETITNNFPYNTVKCFRGSENNVIDRVIQSVESFGYSHDDLIVDISGDCPFIQSSIVNFLLRKIIKNKELDYVHNDVINRSWPDGIDCQVYKLSVLKEAKRLITNQVHMAHSGWNIPHYGSHLFNIYNWIAPERYRWPELGLTLDEKEDYNFLNNIYKQFSDSNKYPQPFSIMTVIKVLKQCPWLVTNKDIIRKVPGNG